MAIINFEGVNHDLPDDMTKEEITEFLSSLPKNETKAPTQAPAPAQAMSASVSAAPAQPYIKKQDELFKDPYFVAASKYLRDKTLQQDKEVERLQMQLDDPLSSPLERSVAEKALRMKQSREVFNGTDQEYAEWGMRRMGQFLYNLPRMGIDAARLRNSEDQSEKEAFLYLLEAYDRTDPSLAGVGRWFGNALYDPLTITGVGSLGSMFLFKQGAQSLTKEGVKAFLKEGVRVGTVAAIDTAAVTGAQENLKQSVAISAGAQEETDWSKVAAEAGKGAAFGFVLGGALGAGGSALSQRSANGRRAAGQAPDANAPREPDTPDILAMKADAQEIFSEAGAKQAGEAPVAATDGVPASAGTPDAPAPSAAAPDAPSASSGTKAFDDLVGALKSVVPEQMQDGTVARLSPEQLAETVVRVSRTLQDLKLTDATNVEAVLRGVGMTDDQMSALKRAAQEAFEKSDITSKQLGEAVVRAVDEDARAGAAKAWDEFEALRAQLGKLDVDTSSRSGSDLASRVGGKYTGENRGLGRDKILEEIGLDPNTASLEQKLAAQEKFLELESRIQKAVDDNRQVRELTEQYNKAIEEGRFSDADNLISQRTSIEERIVATNENAVFGKQMYGWFNKYVARPATELSIANVFSTATLTVNILPSGVKLLSQPVLNALIKGGPADIAAWKEASFFYTYLGTSHKMSLASAKAAFRYERSLISRDPSTALEQMPSIPGLTGRVIRTIPRVVNATDEYIKRMAYTAYTAQQAYGDALIAGAEKGLKGVDLDVYARSIADEAVKKAFVKADAEDVSLLIKQDADLRGLSGAEREAYVNERFAADADLFARMKDNNQAKDYAERLTFTRPFSGDGIASSSAKGVEAFLQRNPIAKLAGNLFWRTPIRVFEEGIRMTPGMNLIAPSFMADLRGVNGPVAQMRAQGQAMLSMSFGAGVMTMYGNGTIVGNGPSDPKQRKAWLEKNTPNSITWPNGTKTEFNRLEPFNIPLKIFTTVLDRISELEYRKAQGEYVNEEMKQAQAWAGVALGTAASIFKDSGLTGGFASLIDFVEAVGDPEKNDLKIQRFLADKARMAIPSTYTKLMQEMQTGLNAPQFDPTNFEQMLTNRINPGSKEMPLKHDIIGNPMTTSYASQWMKSTKIWAGIGIQDGDPHFDKLTPTQQYVITKMISLEQATKDTYYMPYKVKAFGDVDLRKEKTADGKEFLYDRIQRYTIELGMQDALATAFKSMEGTSKGTKSINGVQPGVIKNVLSTYRNAAVIRLMSEESGLRARFIQQKLEGGRVLSGEREVPSQPFK